MIVYRLTPKQPKQMPQKHPLMKYIQQLYRLTGLPLHTGHYRGHKKHFCVVLVDRVAHRDLYKITLTVPLSAGALLLPYQAVIFPDNIHSAGVECSECLWGHPEFPQLSEVIKAPLCLFDKDVCVDRPARSPMMWTLRYLKRFALSTVVLSILSMV